MKRTVREITKTLQLHHKKPLRLTQLNQIILDLTTTEINMLDKLVDRKPRQAYTFLVRYGRPKA